LPPRPKTKTHQSARAARLEAELTELELRRQIDLVVESSTRAVDRYSLWACTWNPAGRPGLHLRCLDHVSTARAFSWATLSASLSVFFKYHRCHHLVERRVRGSVATWKVHANPAMPF
jgi:hypothetical protein